MLQHQCHSLYANNFAIRSAETAKPQFFKEGFISPEIFIYFFIISDSNLTQTQMLTLELSPNLTLIQTLIKP